MAREKYKQLNREKRLTIEALFRAGLKPTQIAKQIGCHVSTIYREFHRGKYEHLNSDYTTEWRYSADKADALCQYNATAKGAPLKIGKNHAVAKFIEDKIKNDKYSPAAVCALLKTKEYSIYGITFCRATIYKYIDDGNIFAGITNKDLPIKKDKKRTYNKIKRKSLPRGRSIESRPLEINTRQEVGHWEMDCVMGSRKSKSRLLVLSERATRMEIIRKIPNGKAQSVISALDALEKDIGKQFSNVFKTITCDNGNEFSDWERLEASFLFPGKKRTTIYFCHPYTACERGTNENINRMIRRQFPKGCNFDKITLKRIREVEHWLNSYPRAILGYRTSEDTFSAAF